MSSTTPSSRKNSAPPSFPLFSPPTRATPGSRRRRPPSSRSCGHEEQQEGDSSGVARNPGGRGEWDIPRPEQDGGVEGSRQSAPISSSSAHWRASASCYSGYRLAMASQCFALFFSCFGIIYSCSETSVFWPIEMNLSAETQSSILAQYNTSANRSLLSPVTLSTSHLRPGLAWSRNF
jgi:hypothetical protein